MPKEFTFEWNGDKLIADMFGAAIGSVDTVLGQTVKAAQASAPRDRGDLANGLAFEPAKREGNDVVGAWGGSEWYTFIVEARHPSKAGFLRQAGDANYPNLIGEIVKRLPK